MVALVAQQGWSVINVDSVVIAERPKLKPHITAMRAAIAARMGLEPDQVGVKATTNEKRVRKAARRASPARRLLCCRNHEQAAAG